jgi:hypothetical protein
MPNTNKAGDISLEVISDQLLSLEDSVIDAGSRIVAGLVVSVATQLDEGFPSNETIDAVIQKYQEALQKIRAQKL